MIVPVGFSLEKRVEFEEYLLAPERGTVDWTRPLDMRLRVEFFDTETGRGAGVWARVLMDPRAEHGHEWATLVQLRGRVPVDRHEYLRELRDHLNEILDDGGQA